MKEGRGDVLTLSEFTEFIAVATSVGLTDVPTGGTAIDTAIDRLIQLPGVKEIAFLLRAGLERRLCAS